MWSLNVEEVPAAPTSRKSPNTSTAGRDTDTCERDCRHRNPTCSVTTERNTDTGSVQGHRLRKGSRRVTAV